MLDLGKFDGVIDNSLHVTREPLHLATVLSTGRHDMKCQKMTQRIDGHVDLRTLLALPVVIAGALAAFERGAPASDYR